MMLGFGDRFSAEILFLLLILVTGWIIPLEAADF
jgi:hypothetical protein